MYFNRPDPDMYSACPVTLNSLNVFACAFTKSRVDGVATGLASSSDKVVISASTCLGSGLQLLRTVAVPWTSKLAGVPVRPYRKSSS